jgi:hypothetical protein
VIKKTRVADMFETDDANEDDFEILESLFGDDDEAEDDDSKDDDFSGLEALF